MGRKFSEEEISRIFEQAAKEQEKGDDHSGLTLSELQSIGQQSGLDPEAIARAAKKIKLVLRLDSRKRSFKSDIGVSGTAELPGKITSSDWEELLPEIRNEFGAPGTAVSDGYRKEWNNGNLKVLVENGRDQDRLRLSSINGRKIATQRFSVTLGIVGFFLMTMGAAAGAEEVFVMSMLTLMSAFLVYWFNKRSLKKWANRREAQMAAITEKAGELALNRDDPDKKIDIDKSMSGYVNGKTVTKDEREHS